MLQLGGEHHGVHADHRLERVLPEPHRLRVERSAGGAVAHRVGVEWLPRRVVDTDAVDGDLFRLQREQ